MSASITRQDQVLSLREREKFKREIEERERALEGHIVVPHVNGVGQEGMSERRQGRWESFMDRSIQEDPNLIKSQIRKMKSVLDKGSPRDLSTKEKKELERQVKEDQEYFKRNMVSEKLYYQKEVFHEGGSIRSNPEFSRAVKAVLEKEVSNAEFQKRSRRYRNNMLELDPSNPDLASVERFRPKG